MYVYHRRTPSITNLSQACQYSLLLPDRAVESTIPIPDDTPRHCSKFGYSSIDEVYHPLSLRLLYWLKLSRKKCIIQLPRNWLPKCEFKDEWYTTLVEYDIISYSMASNSCTDPTPPSANPFRTPDALNPIESSQESLPGHCIHNVGLDRTQHNSPPLPLMPMSERCVGSDGYDQESMSTLSTHPVTNPLSQSRYVHPNGMPNILSKKYPY